jgi:D-sedoheptulose 7-phosphate isomerase
MNSNFFENYFQVISKSTEKSDSRGLEAVAKIIDEAAKSGKKIIVAGNGGSAAMAAHVAVDFTKNAGVRSITFNEADLITCFANDYGYEKWLEKAIEFYSDPGDVLLLISSSGKSPNILNAATKGRELGLSVVTFSGFSPSNPLRNLGNYNFWAASEHYNVVEMTHHIWLLGLVDWVIEKRTGAKVTS